MASEQEAIEHLQATLPREHVLHGARKVSTFIDKFRNHMKGIMQSQAVPEDGQFVVTKEMVDSFVRELHTENQQEAAH
jgi:hypothetical protein